MFFLLSLIIFICSCSSNCPSKEEIDNKALPNSIADSVKKDFQFYKINKMTFLFNDSSIVIYNFSIKNISFVPEYEQGQDNFCHQYSYKNEQNALEYSSSSLIIPTINMTIGMSSYFNRTPFYLFTFIQKLPNDAENGTISNCWTKGDFIFSNYTKIDTIRTSFDSVYYNIYKFVLSEFVSSSINPNYMGYYLYDTLYYSTTKGIVKIVDGYKNVYELIKTE